MKEDRMEDGTGRGEGRQNCSKGKESASGWDGTRAGFGILSSVN